MIKVSVDISAVSRLLNKDLDDAVRKAMSRSINSTLFSLRTLGKRRLAEQLQIKAKQTPIFLIDRAKASSLTGTLTLRDKALSLSAFSPQAKFINTSDGKKLGVTVKLKGVRQLVQGAFLIYPNAPSGKYGAIVSRRVGEAKNPLTFDKYKSLFDQINPNAWYVELVTTARALFDNKIDSDLKFYLSKAGINT